jgi:hypothetical protein
LLPVNRLVARWLCQVPPAKRSIGMLRELMAMRQMDILNCRLTDLAVPVDAAQQRTRKRPARKKAVGDTASPPTTAVPKSFVDRR